MFAPTRSLVNHRAWNKQPSHQQ